MPLSVVCCVVSVHALESSDMSYSTLSSGAAELAHYAKRKIMKVKELPCQQNDFSFHTACTYFIMDLYRYICAYIYILSILSSPYMAYIIPPEFGPGV